MGNGFFKTIGTYPAAHVMKAGVTESAHSFQAVEEFVGHLDGGKNKMPSVDTAYKMLHVLEQYCLPHHS